MKHLLLEAVKHQQKAWPLSPSWDKKQKDEKVANQRMKLKKDQKNDRGTNISEAYKQVITFQFKN